MIWKFANNIEGAKQFLVDYVGNFRQAFLASQFYNFPCFPQTVPDLKRLIAHDPQATPTNKYAIFGDVADWVVNVGYPGYTHAAIDELFGAWTISNMFAQVASGKASATEALDQADREVKRVFAKWQARGKV